MLLRYKVNNNNHRIIFCPDKEGVQIRKKVNSYTSIAKDLKKNYNDKKIVLIYDKKINKEITTRFSDLRFLTLHITSLSQMALECYQWPAILMITMF